MEITRRQALSGILATLATPLIAGCINPKTQQTQHIERQRSIAQTRPTEKLEDTILTEPREPIYELMFVKKGDLYVIDSDGKNERKVIQNGHLSHFAQSPNSGDIAVTINGGNNNSQVGLYQNGRLRMLTNEPNIPNVTNVASDWLGNNKVLYTRMVIKQQGVTSEIRTIDINDGRVNNLTANNPNQDNFLARASSDGKEIVYISQDGNHKVDVWKMNSDGTNPVRLTNDGFNNGAPTWSPDGKKIAYQSGIFHVFDICVINSDGTNLERLTNGKEHYTLPEWSPDGRFIAFAHVPKDRAASGNFASNDIYMLNPTTKGKVKIVEKTSGEYRFFIHSSIA